MKARSVLTLAPRFVFPSLPRTAGLLAGVFLLLLFTPPPGLAQPPPVPHHPGHWSPLMEWSTEAVHMALFPGDGANGNIHSRILWWHGSPAASAPYLKGGMWKWDPNPAADACPTIGSFDGFTHSDVSQAPFDNFCSGYSHLADGRLFLSGGTSAAGEVGIRSATYFDATLSGTAAWQSVPSMEFQRWYNSVQLMPDGRINTYSGSSYNGMAVWGGTSVPGIAAHAKGDLHKLQLDEDSGWDPAVLWRDESDWPSKRFGHSLAAYSPWSPPFLFGGLRVDETYLNDVWILKANAQATADDVFNFWDQLQIAGPPNAPAPPASRAEHAAMMINDGSMIVYGGRNGTDVFNEVWRLYFSQGVWKWELLTQEAVNPGELPGGRFGQTAVYQYSTLQLNPIAPVRDRILVYGGATTTAGALADNEVWELKVDLTSVPHKAKWRKLTVPTGTPKPAARYDHAMVSDPYPRLRVQQGSCIWRMFVSGGRGSFGTETLSNEFWQLWDIDENTVAWRQFNAGPGRRAGHSLIYDGRHHLVLMGGDTGGSGSSNEVWDAPVQCPGSGYSEDDCEYCGATSYQPTWTEVTPVVNSPALSGHTPLYAGNAKYARRPERFTPAGSTGSWETLLNAPLLQEWYPFMFTIANGPKAGKVFNAGPSVASYLLDPAAPSWSAFPLPDGNSGFRGGSAVRYMPDRVMKCGTRDTEGDGSAQGFVAVPTTKYIALDGATPSWVVSDAMDSGRVNHNLTILPSGEVLVNGGTEIARNTGDQGLKRGLVELWRPPGGSFPNGVWYGGSGSTPLEKSTAARDYHSVALLLPDGRVITASGEASPQKRDAQIYCPPYLFNADGTPATRPVIGTWPSAITYGETFRIETPIAGAIASVCLMRPGAVTHGFNQDQLYIPLSFAQFTDTAPDTALLAVAPPNGRIAPPGDYLLFILNQSGVPAVAQWVRLGQCPTIPCDTGPPPQVVDLYADIVEHDAVWLVWYAPGDDATPLSGSYDLRMSTAGLPDDQAYAAATPLSEVPAVQSQGTPVNYTAEDLTECTQYHFALKTRDGTSPLFKNWSLLSNTVTVTTTCGGGPSGGSRAERVDEGRVAGGASATSVSGAGAPLAGIAGAASLDSGVLEAETHRTRVGGWQVTLRRLAEAQGVEAADRDAIVSQVRDAAGAWRTLGRYHPEPGQYPLGLCALRDRGRVVFPAGYTVDRVAPGLRSRGQECAMGRADHSRSGAMGSPFLAEGGAVEMRIGDVLTLTYDSASASPADEISAYLEVRSNGQAAAPASASGRRLGTPLPTSFALHQNQPNPFGGSTTIGFDLPVAGPVKLEVFDLLGRRVATLAEGEYPAGSHTLGWDLRGAEGTQVHAGVYVYRLQSGAFSARRKMSVVP